MCMDRSYRNKYELRTSTWGWSCCNIFIILPQVRRLLGKSHIGLIYSQVRSKFMVISKVAIIFREVVLHKYHTVHNDLMLSRRFEKIFSTTTMILTTTTTIIVIIIVIQFHHHHRRQTFKRTNCDRHHLQPPPPDQI